MPSRAQTKETLVSVVAKREVGSRKDFTQSVRKIDSGGVDATWKT
jgi:hypothetical protein